MTEHVELATEDMLFGGEPRPAPSPATHRELLLVITAGAMIAIPLTGIDEVARLPAGLTPVPGAPASLIGLAKWRSRVVPIVDLGVFLGAVGDAPPPRRPLILVPFEEGRVGFVVDRLLGTCRVPVAAIEPSTDGPSRPGLDVSGVLELAPERLDEASHVPPTVRERCQVPVVDLRGAVRELAERMPARFPGARGE